MKERTKPILNWVVALFVAVGVLLLILFPEAFGALSPTIQKLGYMLADPSMILIEFATRNAISQFGGEVGMEGFSSALILGLTGIAIIFVIAPTFIVFGYKKSETMNGKLRPAAWHLGMGIVLIAIGVGIYSSISFSTSKSDLVAATERQHALDELQFEMFDLHFDASAQAMLPQEKGGGGGHFTTFIADDGSTRSIQLSDLDRYDPGSQFDFVISENISDSTITIIGISNLEGNNPDFLNADGSTGHIQMKLTVNPYEDSGFNVQRENEYLYAAGQ
ncbi:MAG: hypothetical protein GVY20_06115 [Bacteroidetes bacterium]|jgi:hypothetical protein|nr:hypothetical protein [Bacteroidota bacterium]